MTVEKWQELSDPTVTNLETWRQSLERMNRVLGALPSEPPPTGGPGMDPSSSEYGGDDALDPNARLTQLMKETVANYGIRYGEALIDWIERAVALLNSYEAIFAKSPNDKGKDADATKALAQIDSYYDQFYHGGSPL